ncbi:MAG: hypothetical protein ABIJ34_05950 [archaeon]
MKTLIIAPNIFKPFVVLNEKKKNKYLAEDHDERSFPLWSLPKILDEESCSLNVVIVGKPIIYARNLLYNHCNAFPLHPKEFLQDMGDFFSNISSPLKIIQDVQLSDGSKIKDRFKFEEIFYVRIDDAVAHAFSNKRFNAIITCLTDTFEGNSFCIYGHNDIKEADILTSLSTLLMHSKNNIRATKSGFRIKRGVLARSSKIRKQQNSPEKEKIIYKILLPILDKYKKVLMISDTSIGITKDINGLTLRKINSLDKISAVCKYVTEHEKKYSNRSV